MPHSPAGNTGVARTAHVPLSKPFVKLKIMTLHDAAKTMGHSVSLELVMSLDPEPGLVHSAMSYLVPDA